MEDAVGVTAEKDEKLIKCIKKYRVLYDTNHPKYLDTNWKTHLWRVIAIKMNVPDVICKKRWANIRDQFKNHLMMKKKKTKGNKASGSIVKKYRYEHVLQFLVPFIKEQNTVLLSKVKYEESPLDLQLSDSQPVGDYNEEEPRVRQSETEDHHSESADSSTNLRQKDNKELKKKITNASTCSRIITNMHPIDAFLSSLSPTLKHLPPYYQHKARGKIFSTVQELEQEAYFAAPITFGSPRHKQDDYDVQDKTTVEF